MGAVDWCGTLSPTDGTGGFMDYPLFDAGGADYVRTWQSDGVILGFGTVSIQADWTLLVDFVGWQISYRDRRKVVIHVGLVVRFGPRRLQTLLFVLFFAFSNSLKTKVLFLFCSFS